MHPRHVAVRLQVTCNKVLPYLSVEDRERVTGLINGLNGAAGTGAHDI